MRKPKVKENEAIFYYGTIEGQKDLGVVCYDHVRPAAKVLLRKLTEILHENKFFDISTIKLSITKRKEGVPTIYLPGVF